MTKQRGISILVGLLIMSCYLVVGINLGQTLVAIEVTIDTFPDVNGSSGGVVQGQLKIQSNSSHEIVVKLKTTIENGTVSLDNLTIILNLNESVFVGISIFIPANTTAEYVNGTITARPATAIGMIPGESKIINFSIRIFPTYIPLINNTDINKTNNSDKDKSILSFLNVYSCSVIIIVVISIIIVLAYIFYKMRKRK